MTSNDFDKSSTKVDDLHILILLFQVCSLPYSTWQELRAPTHEHGVSERCFQPIKNMNRAERRDHLSLSSMWVKKHEDCWLIRWGQSSYIWDTQCWKYSPPLHLPLLCWCLSSPGPAVGLSYSHPVGNERLIYLLLIIKMFFSIEIWSNGRNEPLNSVFPCYPA